MKLRTFSKLFAAAVVGVVVACSSDDAAPPAITFEGQVEPLSGFSYDTGLIPKVSPAQVSFALSAGGAAKVVALGTPSGGGLVGTPGSGKLSLDVHVKMDGRLVVKSALKNYDGDLPGLADIDIPIAGEVAFDPFLLGEGETATVEAAIPPTKLPPIPLGTVPGNLELSIAEGSVVTTSFRGTCLSVSGGQATYAGETETSGKLVLSGTLAVDLPAPLNKAIDLGAIDVPIPALHAPMSFDPQAAPGTPDGAQGSACPNAEEENDGGSSGSLDGAFRDVLPGPPPSFSVSIDGVTGTPTRYFTDEDVFEGALRKTVRLYFVAPGLGAETRVVISAFGVGNGCVAGEGAQYQPDDGTFVTYFSSDGASCGLSISTWGSSRLKGSFDGVLSNFDGSASVNAKVTFDVPPSPP